MVITSTMKTWLPTDRKSVVRVETTENERNQQLLEFITIYVLKIERQHTSNQDIITLPMTLIIKIYFNKHPMSWELIYCGLLHPYGSVMKEMCHHQTLDGLPKHCSNKINKSPCTISYTSKTSTYPKEKTVETSNI